MNFNVLPQKWGFLGVTGEPSARRILEAFAELGRLDESDLARAESACVPSESVAHAAARLGIVGWESMGRAAAEALGWRWFGADEAAALGPAPERAPPVAFLRNRRAALVTVDGSAVALVEDPFDSELQRSLSLAADVALGFAVAHPDLIAALLDGSAGPDAGASVKGAARARPSTAPSGAAETAQALLEDAARRGASDLHFEPMPGGGRARARIDGHMQVLARLDAAGYEGAVARLLALAGMDVAERRLPQDGRARLPLAGRELDLRLSTVPALDGLALAIRLLDPAAAPGRLDALHLPRDVAAVLEAASAQPQGLFVLTGPTGSGKTTTLHALLSGLNADSRKIVAVEDPIEYVIPGLVQIQVKPEIGLDFARAQRTLLRHNPDVMMVGEIRDAESASVAVQAALTGHLVLTTVHANSAAGAAIRLLDLGVEPFLLSAAFTGAGAQRLARRLCPDCREPDRPAEDALARIGAPTEGNWSRAAGCTACGGTGVRGRVPIAEAFMADVEFAEALRAEVPSEQGLAALAAGCGGRPLHEAALALAAAGEISLAEALRLAPPPGTGG